MMNVLHRSNASRFGGFAFRSFRHAFPGTRCVSIAVVALLTSMLCAGRSYAESRHLGGDRVHLDAAETIDGDLFCAGNSIVVSGTVTGDLFAIGESIEIDGKIGGSVHLLGRSAEVDAEIGGSLRAALGESLTIGGGTIGRDLNASTSTLVVRRGTVISGGVGAAARRADIDADVTDTTRLIVARGSLGGRFGGPVEIEQVAMGGNVAETGMTIDPEAVLEGDLKVRGGREPDRQEGSTIRGTVDYQRPAAVPAVGRSWLRTLLASWVQFAIAGILFRVLFPTRSRHAIRNFGARPLRVVVFGPLFLILLVLVGAAVVAGCAALATGLGLVGLAEPIPMLIVIALLAIAMIWCGGLLAASWVAPTLFAGWLARTLLGWLPGFRREAMLLPIIAGSLIMAAIASLPTVGFFLWGAIALFGSGVFLVGAVPPVAKTPAVGNSPRGYERIR